MNSITVSKTALANAGIFSALMFDEGRNINNLKGINDKIKFESKGTGDHITIDFTAEEQAYKQNFQNLLTSKGVHFQSSTPAAHTPAAQTVANDNYSYYKNAEGEYVKKKA